MRILTIVLALLLTAACAGDTKQLKEQAVEDFISVSELQEVDRIRYRTIPKQEQLTDRHLIMSTRDDAYLVALVRACWELNDRTQVTPDYRRDRNTIWRSDTIRGCPIKAIYGINAGQADELRAIGDAPASDLEPAEPEPET